LALFLAVRHMRAARPDLYWGAAVSLVLVVLQALSGAIVVETRIAILSTLLHSFLISLLFATEAYLWLHTLRLPAGAGAANPQREAAALPRASRAVRA
jgi:cytochrome c oxidase assembly protein subunit 15